MATPLPPDPYAALGLPKDATAATIKSTYRKLVLKCHPDKVTDEALKKQKQEEFHKIQQAYETIGEEEKRATYDAQVRLEQLRKEKLARNGGAPDVEVKTARYDVRTAAPAGASFKATGPHRYEERKPSSRSYDDDRYYDRKYDTYEAHPKNSSSSHRARTEKDREPVYSTKSSSDRTRSERNKTRDKDERRDRSGKFVYIDDDSSSTDEKARYETEYRRRSDDDRRRREEEDAKEAARREAADARRKAQDRRSYEEPKERVEPRRHRSGDEFDRQRKLNDMEHDAVRYIHRSKADVDPRPSPIRTSSSRDVRPEAYDSRSRRPEAAPRRSSALRPKDRPESSGRDSHRDRKVGPTIVEWDERDPPPFKHSVSAGAEIHVPRTTPQRSYTEAPRDHRRTDTSPTPLRRADTTPIPQASSSSRRKEPTVSRPSPLRESGSPSEGESAFASVPPPRATPTSTKYYYPTPEGGVSLRPEDMGVANGHRTIIREPGRQRHRSPSPLSPIGGIGRPPIGPNRIVETTPAQSRSTSSTIPPPLGRSATFNPTSPIRTEERGRPRMYYGEIASDHTRRENARRQNSFSPEDVSYSKRILPDDIQWSAGKARDQEFRRPTALPRHATFAY